jgi:hypothetical protein
MFATVTTWRLDESLRETRAYEGFVRDLVRRNIGIARQAGMIDSIMINVEPDLLIGVGVYETEEEAEAAAPLAKRAAAMQADKLEFISRVMGRMDDMPSLPGRPPFDANGGARMHATVTTWRLHESLRAEPAYTAFLRGVMEQNLALALEIGLLDTMIIRTSDEGGISIGMYETMEAAKAAVERATTVYNEHYAAIVELLDRKYGRADDIPSLIGRWD